MLFKLLLTIDLFIFSFFMYGVITSIQEKEFGAARKIFAVGIFITSFVFIICFIGNSVQLYFAYSLLALVVIMILLFIIDKKHIIKDAGNQIEKRYDERDVMFSRNLLIPETDRFIEYYAKNADKKKLDDKFRKGKGLLSENSLFYDSIFYSCSKASFYAVEALHDKTDGFVNINKTVIPPFEITKFIKSWSLQLGAHSVGITVLRNYHLYSHKGRGNRYGEEIVKKHKFAIAITVEMDYFMTKQAPYAPIVAESARQYLVSGSIAVQIAAFIRNLGYSAQAHIDGQYEVVCPLVAEDAGLGEIGRMGILMTPTLGPRVRIAVITTDISLLTDERKIDSSVIDFCNNCKKCALSCPSKSIPTGERVIDNGVKRWKINSEACFTYWCKTGTDCGRCMAVCPYSHPNNLLHNLVRTGIRQSKYFRKTAIWLDNWLYGKKLVKRS